MYSKLMKRCMNEKYARRNTSAHCEVDMIKVNSRIDQVNTFLQCTLGTFAPRKVVDLDNFIILDQACWNL